MSTYRNVIAGLQILSAADPAGEMAYHVGAEHGIIYAGCDTPVSPEDHAKLIELGWDVPYENDRWSIWT